MSDFTFVVGQTAPVAITATDASGNPTSFTTDDNVEVTSSDPSIFSVSQSSSDAAVVTAVAEGTATLTVTDTIASSGQIVSATATVEVTPQGTVQTSTVAALQIVFGSPS